QCLIAGTTPQLYAVSVPYGNAGDQIVVKGQHFGATAGRLTLDGTTIPTTAWSDTSITFAIPASVGTGQKRLAIVNTASAPDTSSINGLALHILGTGYRPEVIEVGPDMWTLIGSPTNLRFRLGTNGTQTPVINAAPGGFTAAQLQTAISALPGLAGTVTVAKTSGGNFRIAITGRHSAQVLTASTTSANAAIRNLDSLNPNADYGTHAVQAALDSAAGRPNAGGFGRGPEVLVVVYPNTDSADPYNPESAYYENLIMHSPVKLQGVGPGGAYADGTGVAGTVIDGSANQADAQSGTDWFALADSLAFGGNQNIYEGETLMVVANDGGAGSGTTRVAQFRSNFPASIDGLKIMGGRHDGFPNNRDPVTGAPNGQTATVETQGGGIYVNGQAHSLQITNDVIQGNSGAYGGGIRLGTPNIGSNQNDGIRIAFNRIDQNGGTNLAGGVGIFAGATNYRIDHNTLCGNNSAEYGGAISHFGLSNGGKIDHNRIWFNRSYDEGGAVFVGSELPVNPNTMPVGAGAVDITENTMQANLANDDGGAIRLLMVDGKRRSQTDAGGFATARLYDDRINILNNTIANNVSTHEGGGIALDDSTNVVVANNTVVHNITTATAMTSTGDPAPAGLSTAGNSFLLQAELDKRYGANIRPLFSKPTLFNNVFTDNRSGSWSLTQGLHGIGQTGDASPINLWDIGLADNLCASSGNARRCLSPLNNTLDSSPNNTPNMIASPTNLIGSVVNFVDDTYRVSINALPWRGYPQFVGAVLVAVERPFGQMGNYHLAAGANSPVDNGRASAATQGGPAGTQAAPANDIDDQARPFGGAYDIGSDERQ
ncbi:MAG: large repetitive protein, partial [Gaiellales bacterium]|nr:large repetitive protein [Gaiellales bacterium]